MPARIQTSSPLPRWRVILFFAIVALGIPAAFLGLVETGLRLTGYGYPTSLFLEDPEKPGLLRENPDFTSPWFGRKGARQLFPLTVQREAPEGTFRILILGASAALGDPAPSYSPARMLEVALEESYPGGDFECINLAITAINSHVVREVAEQSRILKADLAIIYLGNNEVIGPAGPRFLTSLRRTRLHQLVASLTRTGQQQSEWAGMAQFLEYRHTSDSPELQAVYRAFRANLESVLESLEEAGTEAVLSTVAVNLLRQPPFWGEDALENYLDGSRLAGEGDPEEAYRKLDQARELDQLRFRADDAINRIIRETASREEIPLIEAADAFNSPGRLAGDEEFLEHVHFTFQGNHRLVGLFHAAVSDHLKAIGMIRDAGEYPGIELLKERLAYTTYDHYLLVREMIDRRGKAPFTEVYGNSERLAELIRERDWLEEHLRSRHTRDAILGAYSIARAHAPADWVLQRNHADALRLYGRFGEAAELYEEVLKAHPGNEDARKGLLACREHP